jgi:hypothetical protein
MSNDKVFLSEEVKERWEPVIKGESFAPIQDAATERMVNIVLENMLNEAPVGGTDDVINNPTGGGADYATNGRLDPVLIKLVRRSMPALIANDLVGVQPMTGPTGLIFALRSYYGTDPATRTEAFGAPGTDGDPSTVSAADQYYSGNKNMGSGADDGALTTPEGEQLGQGLDAYSVGGAAPGTEVTFSAGSVVPADATGMDISQVNPWNEMSFSIEKSIVSAESRALKARYTTELAQDLKVTHGLDAATELSNILSTEIITEQNREMITLITAAATTGAQDTGVNGVDAAGTFNLASAQLDARWEVEKYKMMLMMIVREANIVAKLTGRGAANRLIVSPEVANALDMVTALTGPGENPNAVNFNGNTSGVGVTYAGSMLAGRFKVYVDQYAAAGSIVLGYKGANVYDAGMYYCPYVPLQMMKAIGEEDFQPRIGFKTRYGIAYNPFGAANYYRKFTVAGI